jgi:hypothetical protein
MPWLVTILSAGLFVVLWCRFDGRRRKALVVCYLAAIPPLFFGLIWLAPAIVIAGLFVGWANDW